MGEREPDAAAGRDRLPPVAVDCNWCGCQFLSRARHGQKVRCPRCKHDIRVRRWEARTSGATGPAAAPAAVVSPAAAPASPPLELDDDDDGKTYVHDERGRLVLAEWTPDGRLVPAGRQTAAGFPARPRPPEMTWAAALAALGWRLEPGAGGCQVRTPDGLCGADATRRVTGGWACGTHYAALCSVINGRP